MVLLSRRILALWSARGELERTQDPGRVPRQFFARLCLLFETGCVGRRAPRGPVGSHPPEDVRPAGTRRPAPRLVSRGVPTSCDELCSPDPAPQFPSMGARNSRELDTLGEIMDRLAVGEFGRAADLVT